MPQKRQGLTGSSETAIVIRSLGLRMPADHVIDSHEHDWPQLVYASEGVMTVSTGTGSWVVPPRRAVWIPAGFEHSIRMTGQVRMQTLYLRPGLADGLPLECSVIDVTPLLRELVLEVMGRRMLREDRLVDARLAAVITDQIIHTRVAPLQIVFPKDERARKVVKRARADLSRPRTISELVDGCGASVRTIERIFLQETGMSFGRWLQQVKALFALERLAAGDSVTAAGLAVGYDSTSAFIAMFKRVLGTTPGNFFQSQGKSHPS